MSMKKVFEVAMLLTAKDEATKKILEASKAQQAAIKSMSGYGDKAFGVGVGAGAIGVGISAGIGVTIKAAEESEIAYNKMNLALKLGGDLQEKRAKAAAQYANNLQFQIGIEDEEIEMTQTKLASFHKLTTAGADVKNVFDRATKAAYDMAAGGFGDAIGNANILGKALQNPAAMATALAKSGSLDKGLDIPLIKRIQASKGLVAAQDYILKAVEKQYKGQSEAAATATSKMRVKWAEVSETLGKTLLPQFMKLMTAIGNVADRFHELRE